MTHGVLENRLVDGELDALEHVEEAARMERIRHKVLADQEQQRQAEERAAIVARWKDRLAGLDMAPIDTLQAQAAAALDAYIAAMGAYNEQVAEIRDELQELGSGLPAGVELYPHTGGLVIGEVEARRQRMQSNMSQLAMAALRKHITRGQISLDTPRD